MLGDNHLSGMIVTNHLKQHSHLAMSTALHTSKDFAVSIPVLPLELAQHLLLSAGRLEPFGSRRLCSHLLDYSRRALPATVLQYYYWVCSDFPHLPFGKRDCLVRTPL